MDVPFLKEVGQIACFLTYYDVFQNYSGNAPSWDHESDTLDKFFA